MVNTDSVLFKLLNDKIKGNSEQLNKIIAGLFDSDGCVGLKFNMRENSSYREGGYYLIQLSSQIDQSASNDPDLQMIHSLQRYFGFGVISYRARENWAHQATLAFSGSDSESFFNLVGKHMNIKGTHFDNMLWLYKELKGVPLTASNVEEIKEFSKCSRDNSGSLKGKKHISPAYLAGLIAGDGWITVRLNVPRLRNGWLSHENQMSCAISLHRLDSDVLYSIQKDYGGNVRVKDKDMVSWKRNLGKESKTFAKRFLSDLMPFMLVQKKYEAMERIRAFHELPAETKCLDPEKGCDSPRR